MDNEVKNVVESATADGTRPDGSGAADGRSGAEADGEEEGMSLADIYSEKTKRPELEAEAGRIGIRGANKMPTKAALVAAIFEALIKKTVRGRRCSGGRCVGTGHRRGAGRGFRASDSAQLGGCGGCPYGGRRSGDSSELARRRRSGGRGNAEVNARDAAANSTCGFVFLGVIASA